jgi:hypothetical protein
VVLQAVIDDSGKSEKPVFVLAGFVLSVDEWTAFADQWQNILDGPPKLEYFKMSEAHYFTKQFARFSRRARDERLQQFVSLIMHYSPLAIREVIYHEIYQRLFKGQIAKGTDYPYFLCVNNIIGTMLRYQYNNDWHINDKVDFIFDEQGKESDAIQRVWRYGMRILPPVLKPLVGNRPAHRDEKTFLPLQAADLFAWQSRRFYYEKAAGKDYNDPTWQALSTLECAEDEWTEQRLKKIVDGVKASGLVFEYDVSSPKARKAYKKELRRRFPPTKK